MNYKIADYYSWYELLELMPRYFLTGIIQQLTKRHNHLIRYLESILSEANCIWFMLYFYASIRNWMLTISFGWEVYSLKWKYCVTDSHYVLLVECPVISVNEYHETVLTSWRTYWLMLYMEFNSIECIVVCSIHQLKTCFFRGPPYLFSVSYILALWKLKFENSRTCLLIIFIHFWISC